MTITTISFALDSNEPVLIQHLEDLLTEGYAIIDTVAFVANGVPYQRMMLRKDENAAPDKAIEPVNTQVRAIVSIECRETYSKSTQQNFNFWTCILDNGEKVNIFDHPDESRNTYKICKKAGWDLLGLSVADVRDYDPPIPCVVSHDGEWYSLVSIIHSYLWIDLAWHYTPAETPQEELPLDIEYDTDTSDAIANLKSGLNLDEDEDKSFVAHDDAVSNGCITCGNEWMSLNKHRRCSKCQQVWDS